MPIKVRDIKKERVVVIAPHTDDEVISVGGCLALHQRAGSDVLTAYVTSNSKAPEISVARRRMEEAKRVAELLGFEYEFLEYPDGTLSLHESKLAAELEERVRKFRPGVVFCPFPTDHHRDHQATARATARALDNASYDGEVWAYELWSTIWPNVAVNIEDVIEVKKKAISLYESQLGGMHYVDAAIGLNRYRGLRARLPYAEALYVCSCKGFVRIARLLDQI